ncbi:HEPN domain-containing protein [Lutibacter sp. HS1-25]|uniref:HEPN domain-containing protein n=1 Tax=Lutibacter sp. HS1-25 TaxID=2485000 RepID=UPI001012CE3E|nr:HEPN domain-containing protein [Lutibacter sp. HS1-25]RXP45603.1 HEPN domain-containing protein [Lutibacter sp. HS1-25]
MSSRSQAFLNEGSRKLELAKDALNKPSEDIVSYSACKNSQFAIENYLKGFLLTNNVEFAVNATIGELYNQCVEIDENFKKIEISAIKCKNDQINGGYCTGIGTLNACLDAADTIENYLKESKII